MKCPVCKKRINDSAAFCKYCGTPVGAPMSGGGIPAGMPSFCNMCGRALAPGEVCTCTSYTPVTPEPPVFEPAPPAPEAASPMGWGEPAVNPTPSPFGSMPGGGFDDEATVSMAAGLSDVPSTTFCLYCGRVLHSGETCTCSEAVSAASGGAGFGMDAGGALDVATDGTVNVSGEPDGFGMGAPLDVPPSEFNRFSGSVAEEPTGYADSAYDAGTAEAHHHVYTGMDMYGGDAAGAASSAEELKINVRTTEAPSPEEERKKAEGRAFFRPAGDL